MERNNTKPFASPRLTFEMLRQYKVEKEGDGRHPTSTFYVLTPVYLDENLMKWIMLLELDIIAAKEVADFDEETFASSRRLFHEFMPPIVAKAHGEAVVKHFQEQGFDVRLMRVAEREAFGIDFFLDFTKE